MLRGSGPGVNVGEYVECYGAQGVNGGEYVTGNCGAGSRVRVGLWFGSMTGYFT